MNTQNLLKLQNGSDIRGVALDGVEGESVNLTEDICFRLGRAFPLWLEKKTGRKPSSLTVGIGRDSRISGPALESALAGGLLSQGVQVVSCALATTPAMFMSIVLPQTHFDASVMITASHLPFNRNGIKFFDRDGGLESRDITAVLEIAGGQEGGAGADLAQCRRLDLVSLYAEYLSEKIRAALGAAIGDAPLSGLKIAVDAGNGAGGFFAEKILKPLGADISGSQFLEPDGRFPNHIPNPENKTAMEAIRSAVLKSRADLGLIFDTDVDRMSAVLSDGTEINRDAIIAMIAAILAPEYPGGTIVTDSVTSDRLTAFLENTLGLRHLRYMRGYKNVINKCKELNAAGVTSPLAMETSGHGALKDNYYLDDGAFLAVRLVIALAEAARNGRKIDSLIERLPPAVEEGEFRLKISGEDFKTYGQTVLEEFRRRAEKAGCKVPESFEGVRVSFPDGDAQGWILLRMSLHDPVMPVNIEGARRGDLARLAEITRGFLAGFDRLDTGVLREA